MNAKPESTRVRAAGARALRSGAHASSTRSGALASPLRVGALASPLRVGALASALRGGALALALVAVTTAGAARADWEPSGAVSGLFAVEPGADERRLGGNLLVDLWQDVGVATFGLAMGVGATTSANDDVNRVFAPLGLSLGLSLRPRPVGGMLFARGGLWAGATNQGLAAGGWASFGGRLEVRLDDTVSLAATVEVWRLFGNLDRWMVLPGLSLVWRVGGGA